MPIPPPHGTYSVPALGIGNSESQFIKPLFVGNSFNRDIAWELPGELCDDPAVPADFTGFTPLAEVFGASGNIVHTLTVTPSTGDATGKFFVSMTTLETTVALAVDGMTWRFSILAFEFDQTLLVAPFELRIV